MDFRLSEEEKLIRETAAQFVRREMMTRERDYLRQEELFLPPGDPPRRELDPEAYDSLRENRPAYRALGAGAANVRRRRTDEHRSTGVGSSGVRPDHSAL